MSLGKLLAAGRGLMGIRDNGSRYQMRTEALLPKFHSDKNPFGTSPVPELTRREPAKVAAAAVASPKPEATKSEPAKLVTHSLFESQAATVALVPRAETADAPPTEPVTPARIESVNVQPPRVEPPVTRPAAAPAKPRLSLAAWVKKLNPLKYLPLRAPGAKAAKSRAVRTPVQTELSLERVKVMRNDLSEADLEVVRARPAQLGLAPKATPSVQRLQSLSGPEPTTWNRLTSRFFTARETTQIR
jgi:hypothetical protein